MMETDHVFLEMIGISKNFSGVHALTNVNITARQGEVLALVGENGAGKSTLMKILSGVYPHRQYEGEIRLNGIPIYFANTRAAQRAGISIIHQELNLIPELSVAENIFLGWEPGRWGMISWKKLYQQAEQTLRQINLDINPRTPVAKLSIGQQQMIEIAKAVSMQVRLLILDEPTSALSQQETRQLFRLINTLRDQQVTCIYISHKLNEVFELADRITVLRDGDTVGTLVTAETNQQKIVTMMVGRDIHEIYPRKTCQTGRPVLSVQQLSAPHPTIPHKKLLDNISLTVHSGEIVGLAGLMGAGRSELALALFGGLGLKTTGVVNMGDRSLKIRSPAQAINAGLGLVTEDRKHTGLIFSMSVQHNLSLAALAKVCCCQWIKRKMEQQLALRFQQQLNIKTPGLQSLVGMLSGGNQQKVVIAKWVATGPKVLILDEPTRGVDVGAKVEIYNIINSLAAQGVGIVVISSELPEVIGVSDRVLVMRSGRIVGELSHDQASQEKIMQYATGAIT